MFARVTQFDIDTVAISMTQAIERFVERVLPGLRMQRGYRGVCVMNNSEGRGMLISYWNSERDAEAGIESGFYDAQADTFITVYRELPSHEQFQVSILEAPAEAVVAGAGELTR